ncbi:hypothetical protein PMIN01_01242 [Paraphaeosphaeria minitans]|uniref:Uncharacterized protein n=1 Tax=Paraphaeosphaeria minitans TaxID=565426 RepID=A0A9P6GUW6_9PLEO|nr:hypothetical protein PMIN01_01242 [Paraphaeosphaeria minitans]
MLFTALAVAGLGVLPVHAWDKPVQEIDFLGPCNPTDEQCELKKRQDDEHQTTDGDWHIGCDEPRHCGYHQDHSNKRSIDPDPNTAARPIPTRSSSQESPNPDWLNIPDRDGIDTRCSLTSIELVEKFNGQHWVHHYKCPPGTSCTDILGSGACRAGLYEFIIPGQSYLWAFDCPDALNDPSTCHFSETMHSLGAPKPQEPYLTGTTRCNPNGRAVQYFDGDVWTDVYSCKAEAACVEHEGRGGCMAGESLSYPLTSRESSSYRLPIAHADQTGSLPYKDQATTGRYIQWPPVRRGAEDQPPTRCHPEIDGRVQLFSEWYHKWIDFRDCDYQSVCHNSMDEAKCEDEEEIHVPLVDLRNGVESWHPIKASDRPPKPVLQVQYDEDDYVLPPIQSTIAQKEGPVYTKCDSLDYTSKFVQYLHPTAQQWLRFYVCGGRCFQFREFAACEEYTDKFVIPSPPKENISKHDAPKDLDSHLLRRQKPHNPVAPDFHTIDTRCNPFDLNEVQRYNGTHWIHHYQCTFLGSCIDVDGHGACRLQDNVYELPSANRTSIKQGEGENPLRVKTRCNKSNASEILEWQGHSWEPQGVCLPPFECFDFHGSTGFALCVQNDAQYQRMWLPWPELSRSTNSGQVTRCKDHGTMEQFKDNAWVPYRRCNGIFTCQGVEGGPNGGCAAPSLYDILTQRAVHSSGYHASREAAPRLPKRDNNDDSLLENSEMLTEQGKILFSEGKDLTEQSNPLLEILFGSRPNPEVDIDPSKPRVNVDIHDADARDEDTDFDTE